MKPCDVCGKSMRERANSTTGEVFLACDRCNATRSFTEAELCTELGIECETKLCPRCGAELRERYNKATQQKFMGCSKYPMCKHTNPI